MYQPKYPPMNPDVQVLAEYVNGEFQSVAQAGSDAVDSILLNVLNVAPKKPRNGMVVCADGVNWQPLGAGGGYFGYFGGAWTKL